ncbi:Kanadaptin [Choanephora cucurbitarum]|uniref:Kanadaptin n=1 Tax=Choanephora cucurbitarum TaxID=101091 RepID=A0A1C7NGB2_9FUNG|nr:Kanadaptin [Choanephora cucurbitarum]
MSQPGEFAIPSLPASKQRAQNSTTESSEPSLPPPPPPQIPKPPPLQYEKPSWSALPSYEYHLEVLKNGASLETIKGPKKEFVSIGRLPLCDILMEHPSISRYQAVIQFDHDGDAYLFDLNSAHGTQLNKKPIPARQHVPLQPGDQIRFGESTRICIFESQKPYDPEAEAEERRKKALQERIAKARGEPEPEEVDQGVTWGFAEDAQEEEEEEEENENTIEDIKASLNQSSRDADLLSVEAQKQAFEDAKRRREDIELMYNDDSDEELYDKTARKKSKKEAKADTHEDLVRKEKEVAVQLERLEKQIEEKKQQQQQQQEKDDEDLDAYMNQLSKKPLQEKSLFLLQKELGQLKKVRE